MKRKKRRKAQSRISFSPRRGGEPYERLPFALRDPRELAWLEHAVDLAIRFGEEVSDDPHCQLIDFIAVGRAAESLWVASPGDPHWRDLDVEAMLALIERLDVGLRDNAIASLIGFTHFLAKHGHVSADEALVMRSRLDRHAPPLLLALGYERVVLPAHLCPS